MAQMSEVEILSPRSRPLNYGDVIGAWCSRCMDRTDHVYKPTLMDFHFSYLICLACHPELKEEVNHERNCQGNYYRYFGNYCRCFMADIAGPKPWYNFGLFTRQNLEVVNE